MKHLALFSIVLLPSMLGCAPVREERVAFDADARSVLVETEVGNVFVSSARGGEPEVVATLHGRRAEFREEVDGGQHAFSVDCPPAALTCYVDFEVALPDGVDLEVVSGSGNIEVEAVELLDVVLDSGSGNVKGDEMTAETLDANSGSGNVTVGLVAAPRRVVAQSSSGDVELVLPSGRYDLTVESGSGSTDVRGLDDESGSDSVIVARSSSGDVRLRTRD